jgi:hypothetical protein
MKQYSPGFIKEQTEVMKALIAFDRPIEELDKMDKVGWDFDDFYLATLRRQDIINVLERFSKGEFTTADIISWGNSFDGRPSVEFEPPYGQTIAHVISILANCIDEQDDPLTPERLQGIMDQLRFAEPDKPVEARIIPVADADYDEDEE